VAEAARYVVEEVVGFVGTVTASKSGAYAEEFENSIVFDQALSGSDTVVAPGLAKLPVGA
jgi:hypothetical protein